MGSMTNALETSVLKHLVGETSYTMPAQLYAGLLTAITDAEAGTVTECADANHVRQAVSWANVSGNATDNDTGVTWPVAAAGYTVVGVGLWDAETAGNLLMVDDVTSVALNAGDQYVIPIGALDLTID